MSTQPFHRTRQSQAREFSVDIQFPDLPKADIQGGRQEWERWYRNLQTAIQDAVDDLVNEMNKKVTKV